MAAKRKKLRETAQAKAAVSTSLLDSLGEELKDAEKNGDKSKVISLKRQIKKVLISTHNSAAELPSIDKLDYEDFSEFDFFGQRVYLGRFRPAVQQFQVFTACITA